MRKRGLWQPLERYLQNYGNQIGPDLHSFLRSNEWQHLHLSSLFVAQAHESAKEQRQFQLPGLRPFIYSREFREVTALLLWTPHGRLLFDCRTLRKSGPGEREATLLPLQELKRLLRKHTTQQFIGTRRHYEFLLSCHDFAFETQEYWIMVRKPGRPFARRSIPAGLNLLRLRPAHFAKLLPLERAYYAEEVIRGAVPDSLWRVLEQLCATRLKQFLQYGIFAGEELVARAMINAYGLYYWQIGGIYTVPQWRRRGLAQMLLQKLCQTIEEAGRLAVLFVRVENDIALGLYDRNSFERLEYMVIAQES